MYSSWLGKVVCRVRAGGCWGRQAALWHTICFCHGLGWVFLKTTNLAGGQLLGRRLGLCSALLLRAAGTVVGRELGWAGQSQLQANAGDAFLEKCGQCIPLFTLGNSLSSPSPSSQTKGKREEYSCVVSGRLGRKSYKEQYAFLYR